MASDAQNGADESILYSRVFVREEVANAKGFYSAISADDDY